MSAHVRNMRRNMEQVALDLRKRRLQNQKDKTMSKDRTTFDDLVDSVVPTAKRLLGQFEEFIDTAAERVATELDERRNPKLAEVKPIRKQVAVPADRTTIDGPRVCAHSDCGEEISWVRSTVPGHGHWYHIISGVAECHAEPEPQVETHLVTLHVEKGISAVSQEEADAKGRAEVLGAGWSIVP